MGQGCWIEGEGVGRACSIELVRLREVLSEMCGLKLCDEGENRSANRRMQPTFVIEGSLVSMPRLGFCWAEIMCDRVEANENRSKFPSNCKAYSKTLRVPRIEMFVERRLLSSSYVENTGLSAPSPGRAVQF